MPIVLRYGNPHLSSPYGRAIALLRSLREGTDLLVGAADDRGGVEPEPLLEHGRVDAAEVDRRAQILAVQPLRRLERGVLGVEATLDALADQEGAAAGAVVGPAAVVADAPPELG